MSNKYLEKIAGSLSGVGKAVGNFAKNVSGENLRTAKTYTQAHLGISDLQVGAGKAALDSKAAFKQHFSGPANAGRRSNYAASVNENKLVQTKTLRDASSKIEGAFGRQPDVADAQRATRNARIGAGTAAVAGAGAAVGSKERKK